MALEMKHLFLSAGWIEIIKYVPVPFINLKVSSSPTDLGSLTLHHFSDQFFDNLYLISINTPFPAGKVQGIL